MKNLFKNLILMIALIIIAFALGNNWESVKSFLKSEKVTDAKDTVVSLSKELSDVVKSFGMGKDQHDLDVLSGLQTVDKDKKKNKVYLTRMSTNMSCDSAKIKFINSSYTTYEEGDILMAKIKECNAKIHNENNEDKVIPYVTVEEDEGEKKILFGTIRLKDGQEIAGYSKAILSIVTGNAFLDDPITGTIVDVTGSYAVDAYLQAAIDNNWMLIYAPTYIPGAQELEDVYKEVFDHKDVKKIVYTVKEFGQEVIDEFKDDPEKLLLAPIEIQKITLEKGEKIVEELIDGTGKTVKKLENSIKKDVDDIIHKPAEAINKPVREVKRTIKKIGNKIFGW